MRGGQYNLTFQAFLEREGLVLRNYENEKPVLVLPYDDSNFSCVVWLYRPRCELIGLEIVGGYFWTGLDQWQANTPFDEHSFIADPQFAGVAAP